MTLRNACMDSLAVAARAWALSSLMRHCVRRSNSWPSSDLRRPRRTSNVALTAWIRG